MLQIIFSANALFYKNRNRERQWLTGAAEILRALIQQDWCVKIAIAGRNAEIVKNDLFSLLATANLNEIFPLENILASSDQPLSELIKAQVDASEPINKPVVVYCAEDKEAVETLSSIPHSIRIYPSPINDNIYHEVKQRCISSKSQNDERWKESSYKQPSFHYTPSQPNGTSPTKQVALGLGGGLLPAAGLTVCAVLFLTAANPPAGATVAAVIFLAVAFACLGFGMYMFAKALQNPMCAEPSKHATPSCFI